MNNNNLFVNNAIMFLKILMPIIIIKELILNKNIKEEGKVLY